ncbi:alkylmercury lyase family protein [Mycobacteroides abscessus]|uniref:alkylmercury lyase family protein n=1 Tax=Mycobacteroides abscessus TaxID=36809 RepID=UPI00078DCD5C|nr:alkylmercury lyase family protein [Mycobacteroides abscessus]AMU75747.1 hypothetical protein A3O06_14785 [Mycobacteroides abscessus]ANO24691.1 hypothetical protein BAB79_14780 [Mycobacteroides abscessus]
MAELSAVARAIRQRIMDQVRADGTVPTIAELRDEFAIADSQWAAALRSLEGAICIAVQDAEHAGSAVFQDEPLGIRQPALGEIVYARPFAAFENHYRVTVDGRQRWYAECAVEACAISGQFPGSEVVVDSVCRQSRQPVRLVGRDGVLIDFEPTTLRVHLGYPVREMPHRVVGWCDYNSFFASEDAVDQWRRDHPETKGITRSPVEMARLIHEFLAVGRLDHSYQPDVPILTLVRKSARFGLSRRGWLGIQVPDPFWLPTPTMARDWKRNGLGNFFRFRLH